MRRWRGWLWRSQSFLNVPGRTVGESRWSNGPLAGSRGNYRQGRDGVKAGVQKAMISQMSKD